MIKASTQIGRTIDYDEQLQFNHIASCHASIVTVLNAQESVDRVPLSTLVGARTPAVSEETKSRKGKTAGIE